MCAGEVRMATILFRSRIVESNTTLMNVQHAIYFELF